MSTRSSYYYSLYDNELELTIHGLEMTDEKLGFRDEDQKSW